MPSCFKNLHVHILIYRAVDISQMNQAPENSPPKHSTSNKDDDLLRHNVRLDIFFNLPFALVPPKTL